MSSVSSHSSRGGRRKKYFQGRGKQRDRARNAAQAKDQETDQMMTRNRIVRELPPNEVDDTLTVKLCVVGVKFECLVQKNWPCETLISVAIAEYHLAYPTSEVPDFNRIYHQTRKEYLDGTKLIGDVCHEMDEIELGMAPTENSDRAAKATNASGTDKNGSEGSRSRRSSIDESAVEYFEFTVLFHRLPLGFTLKQENDRIVVATIYPHSAATHYERLKAGVALVRIGDTSLEGLGLRNVHNLIKNSELPLEIRFCGQKKPPKRLSRRSSFQSLTSKNDAKDECSSVASSSSRRNSKSNIPMKPRVPEKAFVSSSAAASVPTPESNGKRSQMKRLVSERRKANVDAPYPDRRQRLARKQTSPPKEESVQDLVAQIQASPVPRQLQIAISPEKSELGQLDTSCATISPPPPPTAILQSVRQGEGTKNESSSDAVSPEQGSENVPPKPSKKTTEQFLERMKATEGLRVCNDVETLFCDADSNQNDEDNEDTLIEHIKLLQAELIKKHEEAKQIANQLEQYHSRLSKVRDKLGSEANSLADQRKVSRSKSSSGLRLTPEVLEQIDMKSGVPPKRASFCCTSSNVSSISGYSGYSNVSGAPRNSRLSRMMRSASMRDDASVSSCNSVSSERRARRAASQNINNRYNYMPQRYSTATASEAPSSFSSRGGVISRAKSTRDSFLPKNDTPGVGYYDVKVVDKVKGGEIGDSNRNLPWP